MQAEVIAIGDEVLSGRILDTNTQWLSQRLEEMGIRVMYHSATVDELEPLSQVFALAFQRADVVLVTGGLGPTADDLTRDAVAAAAGRDLVLDQQALDYIRQMFARRKREMPKQNERQALFPEGSEVIRNPHGTAPGFALDVPRPGGESCRVITLPGVPAEMEEMWPAVVAHLRGVDAGQRLIVHRQIKCFGAGESQIESMLPDLIRRGHEPRVGITASKTTIGLRIAAEGTSQEECRTAMEPTVATIYQCLGNLIYAEGNDELQHVVLGLLGQQHKTLATAEWGTAGLVADWLGEVPDAGRSYLGGIVVANDAAAERAMSVPAGLIERQGGASAEVAQALAEACRKRFGADLGLAVSQFPQPVAMSEPQPVFLALATADGVKLKSIPFAGHPATLKIYFAKHALNLVRLTLLSGS
jgi:nicotinamide-nucleotide amidase